MLATGCPCIVVGLSEIFSTFEKKVATHAYLSWYDGKLHETL